MAIHDQSYVRYTGPMREGSAAWIIARMNTRTMISFTRTKLLVLLSWLPAFLTLIALFAEYVFNSKANPSKMPSLGGVEFVIQLHTATVALLLLSSGCGIIADDLRYKVIQLYFSKPMTRLEYAAGKFLSLFALSSLVGLLPVGILGVARLGLYAKGPILAEVAIQTVAALGVLVLATGAMCLMVMGLSSLTTRTGYVVLAWLSVLVPPLIADAIIKIVSKEAVWSGLLSVWGNVDLLLEGMLGTEDLGWVGWWFPAGVLIVLAAIGAGLTARRLSSIEGIA